MPKSDPNFYAGHRQRLGQKVEDNKVAQYELLEFWLTKAVPRRDMRKLAHKLMETFGSYHQVVTAPRERLLEIDGVGPAIVRVLEGLRQSSEIDCGERIASNPVYSDPVILANYCKSQVCGKPVEEIHVMYLNDNDCMMADDMHTRGDFDNATVYPRVILTRALFLHAKSVLIYHNHPSEKARFSSADIYCTQQIYEILAQNNIALYDHYLVAGAAVHSIRETDFMRRSSWFQTEQNP
ncbi:RadC family protein [bacterium]|nr:RadC family protein [bacterium]